jgi:hypothetical protein
MATFTRTETALFATPGSPGAIAAGAAQTTTPLDLTGENTDRGCMSVVLIIGGTPPATPPTVQFQDSLDGTTFVATVTYVCPNVASTTYAYFYVPSDPSVKKSQAVIQNGTTTGITAFSQGNTRAIT